ncbi:MAG: gamma-glutamyltransferase, partial [Candidatus Aminicenantes bacterium]|nr:gamma-glutamyltransferase [Candidatus Aminicenantes bacterium]
KPDGSPFKEGDVFVQAELAESLKIIAGEGADAFYNGKIADLIVQDMDRHEGLITKQDLQKYKPILRKPVTGTYRGLEIVSMPPPSSGGTILIEMLNILEGYDLGKMERYAPETLHLVAEAMKLAYYDRARYMGDADFGEVPLLKLISKKYAGEVRAKIDPHKTISSLELGAGILTLEESNETTHYSVIDKNSLAVATTYTLNGGFGSFVVAEGTGILLNNEMADFNMKPGYTDDKGLIGTEPNLIEPHKRMLSSMTPTIVVCKGKTYLITGSPGGRTIINTVLNVLLNVIDFKMPIQEAVDAARMDHEWMPDILNIERSGVGEKKIEALIAMGHTFEKKGALWRQGDAHTILVDPKSGIFYGAADKRTNGVAVGY